MAKPTGKEVAATSNSNMVIVTDQPDYIKNGEGRGSENVGMDDLVVPRLEIVQGLSPAVKPGDPGHVEGATLGDLLNSVTRQLFKREGGVMVVPVYYSMQYLVWRKREYRDPNNPTKTIKTDGGFFGAYNTVDEAERRAEEEGGEANGIEVLDTPQHFCLLLNHETGHVDEIMLSMPRTKAKISRQWNSLIRLNGGDRFSRVYRIGTQLQKNSQGDFYNFEVKAVGFPPKAVYEQAEKLYEIIASGERKVTMDVSGLDPNADESGNNAAGHADAEM